MDVLIFFAGLIVTIVAGGAVGTIWWAALRDGETDRRERTRREADTEQRERAGADPVNLTRRGAAPQ